MNKFTIMTTGILWALYYSLLLLSSTAVIFSETVPAKDPRALYEHITNSNQVGMIEFYSSMCGGCTEFAPTWKRIAEKVEPFIITGKINIDDKAGLKIAQELGVLDDGVPHIRIFNRKSDMVGAPILKSDSSTGYEDVMRSIKKHVKNQKSEEQSGIYVKK